MICLSFRRWDDAAGWFFTYKRLYFKGYIWTPFVRMGIRRVTR